MTLDRRHVLQNIKLKISSLILLVYSAFILISCVTIEPPNIPVAANSASATEDMQKNNLSPGNAMEHPREFESDNSWNKHEANTNKPIPNASENMLALRNRINVKNRMSLNSMPGSVPLNLAGKKYNFKIEKSDIRVAIQKFAKQNDLDIFIDRDIEGSISTDFKNKSLKNAMTLLLGSNNYYWTWSNELIRISRFQTKVFVVDYLRLTRTAQAASNSSIITGTSVNTDNERSASSIQKNDNLAFWDELEIQIGGLISDQGRFVINRLSGTIQVTDSPKRITEINGFLASLQSAIHRQVEIDARIIEVTLRDDHALGIDWNAINIKGFTSSLKSAITGSNQGLDLKTNTLAVGYDHSNFTALISALDEQGTVNVVSQPRIRILNNQPALIKVGTDRTFFTQTASRFTTLNGGTEFVISEEPTTVTEGLVLSVTPQISKNRYIMLDISPVITRVADVITSPQGSTAPVLDIKQASTMVRAKDGEMIILGGLIQDSRTQTDRQVPFFTKIPLIGKLFEGTYSNDSRKELVIFLIPRLIL